MALLEVSGLVKWFGSRQVVKGVSFNVSAGEVVGLLGPNGAGKTTSFRMATGQIAPNDGTVIFNGEDVTTLPMYQRARRGMGYLSQEPSVFRKLTVEKNLLAILEALPRSRQLGRRLTGAERRQRTNENLARFKLEHVRHNVAGRCSGGEKRRLEIARCLVCEPMLILLDEPFAAVDPITVEDIRANIRSLAEHGIGILITDHSVREVFRSADRVYIIHEGSVVSHGTPHELVNDQKAIDAYLGRSFEEDGFTRQFRSRKSATLEPEDEPLAAPVSSVPKFVPPAMPAITPPPREDPRPPRAEYQPPRIVPPSPPSAFPTITPMPGGVFTGSVGGMLSQELLRREIESLVDDSRMAPSTAAIIGKGESAIPLLLEALDRREPLLRGRAFEVLKYVAKTNEPLNFDPDAPEDVRLRQTAFLRAILERRPSHPGERRPSSLPGGPT